MEKDNFLKVGVAVIIVFLLGVFLKLAKPILVPAPGAQPVSKTPATRRPLGARRRSP